MLPYCKERNDDDDDYNDDDGDDDDDFPLFQKHKLATG